MTSRSWRIPFPALRERAQVMEAPRRLQRFPVLLFLCLMTLGVGWLYLALTMHSASMGLDIQTLQQESAQLERESALLEQKISELGSQVNMSHRAALLGFEVRPAEYVLLEEPLPPHDPGSAATTQRGTQTR